MKNNLEETMTEPTKEQDSIFQEIEWASNTHKEKLMFGLDELGASIAREHRLHGVLMSAKNELTRKDKEIKTLKEQFEDAIQLLRRTRNACSPSDIAACEQALKDFLEKQDKENKDEK